MKGLDTWRRVVRFPQWRTNNWGYVDMKKRQAYEVAAEIEKKWQSRYGCQCWSWGHHLIQWLLDRWKFKNPQDVERREFIAGVIRQSLVERFRLGLPMGWLYVSNVHIREMMLGAGLNVSEPVRKPAIVHDRVIEIPTREADNGGV